MSKYGFYDEWSRESLIREILMLKGRNNLAANIESFLKLTERRMADLKWDLHQIEYDLSDINLEKLAKAEREKFNEVRRDEELAELEMALHLKQVEGLMLDFFVDNGSVKSNWERFNNYRQTKKPYEE